VPGVRDAAPKPPCRHEAFGSFVRSQRQLAKLSLRQASQLARISNPYLSQIEHGVALPSITVLGALAEALSVSVETLIVKAVGTEPSRAADGRPSTEDAIHVDPRLTGDQKQALLTVLMSFTQSSNSAETPPAAAKQLLPAQPKTLAPRTARTARTARTTRTTQPTQPSSTRTRTP
jgi:transcriptional regulator with XRE-family HTH domain